MAGGTGVAPGKESEMKPEPRRFPTLCVVLGAATAALMAAPAPGVRAHGSEARYVVEVDWTRHRIAHTYGLSYSELGLGAYRNEVETRTVGGRRCVVGGLIGFDVDDAYAFDVDEPVTLTLTYAPALTTPFTVVWDRNGGDGLGRTEVRPEAGEAGNVLQSVTLTLDRARLAGQGTRGIDVAAGSRDGLAVCDVEVTRSGATAAPAAFGRVRLEVTDAASGRPAPARVGLYDATGRLPLPSDDAVLVHRYTDEVRRLSLTRRAFWPSPHRQAFYVNGGYEARVPAGAYELVVTRGIEYRVHHAEVEVRPGETATVPVALERYADQPARGWYSGDAHVHIQRDTVRDESIWAQVAAEDVHVANLLQMGNMAGTHFGQPAWGAAGRFERDGHALVSGQEDPRTVHRGHTIHHNLQRPLHVGPEGYFLYHRVFEESRRQGGVSGYAHQAELFNGRRGIALDVPFGIVDFVEILQQGRLPTDLWYGFLDLGYKLLPAAGSDFPYMDLPGVVRSYARIDGPFSVDAWFDAFRAGRLYVTNGPLLEVTANGGTLGRRAARRAGRSGRGGGRGVAQPRSRPARPARAGRARRGRRRRARSRPGPRPAPGDGDGRPEPLAGRPRVRRTAGTGQPDGRPHRAHLRDRGGPAVLPGRAGPRAGRPAADPAPGAADRDGGPQPRPRAVGDAQPAVGDVARPAPPARAPR